MRISDVVMSELGVVMPEPETVVRSIYAAVGKPWFPTLSQTLKCGVPYAGPRNRLPAIGMSLGSQPFLPAPQNPNFIESPACPCRLSRSLINPLHLHHVQRVAGKSYFLLGGGGHLGFCLMLIGGVNGLVKGSPLRIDLGVKFCSIYTRKTAIPGRPQKH